MNAEEKREEIRAAMLRVIRERPAECTEYLHVDAPNRAFWLIDASGYGRTDLTYVVACCLLVDEWDTGIVVAGQLTLPF